MCLAPAPLRLALLGIIRYHSLWLVVISLSRQPSIRHAVIYCDSYATICCGGCPLDRGGCLFRATHDDRCLLRRLSIAICNSHLLQQSSITTVIFFNSCLLRQLSITTVIYSDTLIHLDIFLLGLLSIRQLSIPNTVILGEIHWDTAIYHFSPYIHPQYSLLSQYNETSPPTSPFHALTPSLHLATDSLKSLPSPDGPDPST